MNNMAKLEEFANVRIYKTDKKQKQKNSFIWHWSQDLR